MRGPLGEDSRQQADPHGVHDSLSVVKSTTSQATAHLYEFGPFRLDPFEHRLQRGDEVVPLAPKAFDTLLVLVRNSGHLIEKDELIRRLWPDSFVDEGGLTNNIFLLRKILGEYHCFIETVPRRGYRFVGAVRQFSHIAPAHIENPLDDRLQPDDKVLVRGQSPGALAAGVSSKRGPQWRSRATIAATALLVLVGASWSYRWSGRSGERIDSVAVLPFVNVGADPNTEYLSDGISESLINSLSQSSNLKVMSRDSAFRYKGRETDAQTVGRELKVRAVFKGRVTKLADNLSISAELIDARDNSHIWGQQYTRKSSDIFTLPRELASEIATAMRVKSTVRDERRMAKNYTANPEAYQDYLKGRYLWNRRTDEGWYKAIEYFQQAIAKDPNYALAYSGIADCYNLFAVYGTLPPKEASPKAKEAALKALELDDTLAEAHVSLARVKAEYDWDWSGGEREFQRAIDLNPNYATAYQWYGDILETIGRPEEAVAEYTRALQLDPFSLIINRGLGQALIYARRYDQAIEQLRKTLELDPYFPGTHIFLSRAYLHNSMYKEGIEEIEKGIEAFPHAPYEMWHPQLAYAYAAAGRRAEAQKILDRLKQLSYSERPLASIYAALGEKDRAFEWMEKGFEDRTIGFGGTSIKVNPEYDPLRSDPRFANLLRRMNLQP